MAISDERKKRLAEEQAHNAQGGGNIIGFKDREMGVFRLLPIGEGYLGTKVVAYFIGNKPYVCNQQTNGKPGVIDRTIAALTKLGDAEAQELAETLTGQKRTQYYMRVIDRNDETKPCFLRTPAGVYHALFNAMKDDGDELDDPENGSDFRVKKTGSGLNTEYTTRILSVSPLAKNSKALKALIEAAKGLDLASLKRADEVGAFEALAELIPKSIWKQIKSEVADGIKGLDDDADDGDAEDEDDDEGEEKPAKGKKAAKPEDDEEEDEKPAKGKAKAKPAAEEEEEDEDDEDEDEEEEVKKPAAKAKGKKAAEEAAEDDDDEDEEEEDEEEDEEDEKPAKGKKSKDAEDEEDDEEDDDEDEEEVKKPAKGKKAKVEEEEEEEEDDDEEEEEVKKPAKKKRL